MEYATPFYCIFGLIGMLAWIFINTTFLKKAQIYMPKLEDGTQFSFLKFLIVLMGILSWAFISYALTRPRIAMGTIKDNIEVNDIFFVIDVSSSMLANDFSPNRLEAAKQEIKTFVELRPTDRIGIIMFSEKAFTLLPLSTDLELVERAVDEIKVGFLGSGTNIGDALGLAVARLGQSLTKNKVIILLTDGVSNIGNITPLEAAHQAKNLNIKVYAIGMGRSQGAKMPVQGPFGRTHYQTIPGGSIDLATLKKIATITGSKMYTAGNINSLKDILLEINEMEKTDIKVSNRVVYKEKFYPYLVIGVFLLILSHFSKYTLLKEIA